MVGAILVGSGVALAAGWAAMYFTKKKVRMQTNRLPAVCELVPAMTLSKHVESFATLCLVRCSPELVVQLSQTKIAPRLVGSYRQA